MAWLAIFIATMLTVSVWSISRTPMMRRTLGRHFPRLSTSKIQGSASKMDIAPLKHNVDVVHPSFELVENTYISEYGITALMYNHKKTGAQVMSVIADDENKVFGINFRTPPKDSTGVPHILEHSVLCGSRKFPVKEPFVDLLKGSLQNFLNAFTYPDRTCYPVASTNTKDFYNLIHVYLDAVLHPRAVHDKQVLQQEGWHYELEDPSQPLTFKGVVYNEMRGVYSSPDSLLGRATQQALFPDNTYGVDSGGDPLKIPDLTFEQFKAFHASYYHPSNSRIYFYGNDDPQQRLVLLEEYLKDFERIPITSQIKYQPKNLKPRRIEVEFPIGPGSEPKHMVTINWLLNDVELDAKHCLALSVLDSLLLGTSSSTLRKTLTESQLGESVTGGGLSDELLQFTFGIGLKGVQPSNVPKVEELVLTTLLRLSEEGFDKADIEAAMNTLEFRLREFNTGSFPRGLSLMLGMLSHWIYDKPPTEGVRFETALQELKNDISSGKPIFQNLLKMYLVGNEHRVTVEMKPNDSLEQQIIAEEESRLARVKENMSRSEIEEVIASTKRLKEAQIAEDSPEAKATLPRLDIDDIDKKTRELPILVIQKGSSENEGVTILSHPVQTNGILYADIAFDFSQIALDDLVLLPIFSRMVMETGTSTLDEVALSRKIGAETGGISTSFFTDLKSGGGKVVDPNEVLLYFMIRGKAVPDKVPVMLNLFSDLLMNARFNNQKRAIEMLKESKARRESSVISSGHTYAATRLAAKFSFLGYLGEQMGGITAVREAGKLLEQAENDWPAFQSRLERMRQRIVQKRGMIVNLTGDDRTLEKAIECIHDFIGTIPSGPISPTPSLIDFWRKNEEDILLPKRGEGFIVPSQVNYVVKGGSMFKVGDIVPGSYSVVSRFLSTGYLWDNVRVLGGAYGGFARFSESSGRFVYMSYRDPNLVSTIDVYDNAPKHLREVEVSASDILQGIIGSIGDLDGPLSPDQKGYASLVQYVTGETAAERQKFRDEILKCTAQDFKDFAEKLEAVAKDGSIVIVGSQNSLEGGKKVLLERSPNKAFHIEHAILKNN